MKWQQKPQKYLQTENTIKTKKIKSPTGTLHSILIILCHMSKQPACHSLLRFRMRYIERDLQQQFWFANLHEL